MIRPMPAARTLACFVFKNSYFIQIIFLRGGGHLKTIKIANQYNSYII